MSEHLLSVWSTGSWVLQDFWISLLVAGGLLVVRGIRPRRAPPPSCLLQLSIRAPSLRWSTSASTIPILVWALEANHLQRVISSTHASIQPRMLLASMQEILGAILLLVFLIGLDLLGRLIESRRQGLMLAPFPTSMVLVVLTVVADWLLSEIGWWSLIHEHMGLRLP